MSPPEGGEGEYAHCVLDGGGFRGFSPPPFIPQIAIALLLFCLDRHPALDPTCTRRSFLKERAVDYHGVCPSSFTLIGVWRGGSRGMVLYL